MCDFGGVLEQDLGDFVFESDARSLQRILDHRDLSPTSLGHGKTVDSNKNNFKPSLTPAKNIPRSMRKQKDVYDFFEAKNGAVFCRKRNQVFKNCTACFISLFWYQVYIFCAVIA